jgi:DNA mismatch endonuclease (patch repair protein)
VKVKRPQFRGLLPTSEAASASMRGNKAQDTRPEVILRKALWRRGYRYRLHDHRLPGKPDLVFSRQRVVIFCDGDFWHGRDWEERRTRLESGSNAGYWVAKIEYNMRRDKKHNSLLRQQGWKVVRVWEGDLRRDPELVLNRVAGVLSNGPLFAWDP